MKIIIDGRSCQCLEGEFLREVARRNGISIPGLCHHAGLPGQGCCRVCLVEVFERGKSKIVTSCVYPIESECEVFTKSAKVVEQRAMILALLAKRAPHSAEIAALCRAYAAPELLRLQAAEEGKCIMCGLCARACKEVGAGAISSANRGIDKEIATPYHEPNPACLGCGSCAAVCPTKAITITETAASRLIWDQEFALLYCAGCGAVLGTAQETAHAAKRAGLEEQDLCEICRQKKMAVQVAKAYGI